MMNIDRMVSTPHTLIAGTTGSGKSVLLNQIILGLKDRDCLLDFIDLKRVELNQYKNLDGTMGYITEPEDVLKELWFVCKLMDERYQNMVGKKTDEMHIYIVIDELADLLTVKGVIDPLIKIGRLGRAAGIHLLCATQDPSRHTLSAQLMQNFTCKIALRCEDIIESRQVINMPGAEQLPKYGYGILKDADGVEKFQIPYISDEEILARVNE